MLSGFTSIPNAVLESLYSSDFTRAELKVILVSLRYSLGESSETFNCGFTRFQRATGLSRPSISKSIKTLREMGMLKIEESSGHKPTTYRLGYRMVSTGS